MNGTPSIFINAQNVYMQSPAPAGMIELTAFDGPSIAPEKARTFEYRELGGGKAITQKEALAEVEGLGSGWRLETPHELFALVDYSHKNGRGAYTRDPMLKDGYYWTSQVTPWFEGGRVVVGFGLGYVAYYLDGLRAFARAVRVSGQ